MAARSIADPAGRTVDAGRFERTIRACPYSALSVPVRPHSAPICAPSPAADGAANGRNSLSSCWRCVGYSGAFNESLTTIIHPRNLVSRPLANGDLVFPPLWAFIHGFLVPSAVWAKICWRLDEWARTVDGCTHLVVDLNGRDRFC